MDLDLCQKALRLNPDLWTATQLAARIAKSNKVSFPITDVEGLIAAGKEPRAVHCRLEGMTLTGAHARDYFPKVFFPIQDRDELLTKLYAALCWARTVHHSEQRIELHRQSVA